MVPNFDVKGKVFVITGAAGILCSEMARELGELGARVAVLDLNEERAKEVAKEICDKGGDALGLKANVLDKDSLTAARDAVLEKFGTIDVLINGAGGNRPDASTSPDLSFFDMPPEALRFVFDLNLVGAILSSQVFGKVLTDKKEGNIINISSMSALRPLTNVLGYSAAKAAVSNFTAWLAGHFALNYSPNIRVNAIAPGFLLTEQNRFLLKDKETGEMTPRAKHIIGQTPMGRYGTPEELVGAIVFLASDAASFVTGTVLCIDGGFGNFAI
ncbi:SDR family oxidoreductase [Christensenellaceae bacterium NSJ-44]|uniref:SDR family oxidoreductase n=3 Tax=Luoshenia tenuis TaxID=2763654 RepID=A0A926D050_9FIRM|nr:MULTISPECIES: SDR family oxidoreductase [Clostridia]MBC8528927.1 SDR family oxidoreductase [Luoshenia tenuis]SCJ18811.1 Uncharacterized oxidoreductase HI_0048 [uncultured Clostridium sp.]